MSGAERPAAQAGHDPASHDHMPASHGRAELWRKICRLICVPIRNYRGEDPQRLIDERAEYPWGGYTIFKGELEAVRSLLARLREASSEPLLLASDLERGLGQHLRGGTSFPPPMSLGAAGDPDLVYAVGQATAGEAAAAGLNCVFAPVLDLANDPANPIICTRSFGDDPEAVGDLGAALVRGLQDGGVLATAKHFPGHGRTRLDSHSTLPVVKARTAELQAEDLLPFRRAIAADVALVMSAHVAYPALEPAPGSGAPMPATLSPAILDGLLRRELRFRGTIVSDALMMGALAGVEPGELAARALAAGIDCLLYPPDPRAVARGLLWRVEEGELAREVVERAVRNLERSLGHVGAPTSEAGHRGGAIPLAGADQLAVRAARAGLVAIGDVAPSSEVRTLVLLLLDGGLGREDVILPSVAASPRREFRWLMPEEGATVLPEDLAIFDEVYLAYFSPIRAWKGRAGLSAEAADLTAELLAARRDTILISFSSPFILRDLPALRGAILAFGEVPACQVAVGEVLAGHSMPDGRLPVRLRPHDETVPERS